MHKINKLRLLAGITIDPKLEQTEHIALHEARTVPLKKSELKPQSEKSMKAKLTGVTKACAHLMNAIKALDAIPATDFSGDVPHYISEIDDVYKDLEKYKEKCEKECKTTVTEKKADKDYDKDDKIESEEAEHKGVVDKAIKKKKKELKEMGYENEERNKPASTEFKKGQRVLFDNGVWIVHVADAEADMVGIIPPSMRNASKEEKAKAMQQVKPDKLRRPSEEEEEVMAGPDGILGTADDVRLESMDKCPKCGCDPAHPKKGCDCTYDCHVNEGEEEYRTGMQAAKKGKVNKSNKDPDYAAGTKAGKAKEKVKESTLNYTQSNAVSHEDTDSDPANVVGHGSKNWQNSLDPEVVKTEYTAQLDNRGDQSMDDYEEKVKVPSRVKEALKGAISEFEKEAKKFRAGQSAQETTQFYQDAAEAFGELLEMLNAGTIVDVKRAQVYASSLMGPMLHKLPDQVWDFVTNGGQKRSLADYMNKVKIK